MELTEAAMDELYDALHSIEYSLSRISDIEEKKYELMLHMYNMHAVGRIQLKERDENA